MKNRFSYILLVSSACVGAALWGLFALPRYTPINLSVDQSKAVTIAAEFLQSTYKIETNNYKVAALFGVDQGADRYLQKTIGFEQENKFLKKQGYDLFYWIVRFFKAKQKEEFKVVISSQTGQVIGFHHVLDEAAARPEMDTEIARAQALAFLVKQFSFDPDGHSIHNQQSQKFDHRQDHAFSWKKNDVNIPWNKDVQSGGAKLITHAVVTGGEIISFSKGTLDIPDAFNRTIENLKETGQNWSLLFRLLYLALLTIAIMLVVNRKGHLLPRTVRPFYMRVALALFVVAIVSALNGYYLFLFEYPTAQSFPTYFMRALIDSLIGPFFIVLAFVLPCISGEMLRFEVANEHKSGGFLKYILSSFWTREASAKIVAGYFAVVLILGVQAFIFELGYRYCGVWQELSWLTQSSSAIFPAVAALYLGMQASFSEEGMFRLFGINLGKKYLKNTALALIVSAFIWGFGHTGYPIFPMWFRGIEVMCLGIIFGIIYLRFGILTTVVAHFLMDAFLMLLPYLLKPRLSFDFYSACFVILIPLIMAIIAWIYNQQTTERPLTAQFNAQQQFNSNLLQDLAKHKTTQEMSDLKKDLIAHGWDPVVVDAVI